MSFKLESAIRSRDTGQRMPIFERGIDHNMDEQDQRSTL